MTTQTDPDGDVPIDLTKCQFTLPDAAYLARLSPVSLRNWQARDVVRLGHKSRITGRWLFSVLDILRFAIMHDLCAGPAQLSPYRAAAVAELAVAEAVRSTAPGANRDARRPNVNVLVGSDGAGELVHTSHDMKSYPPGHYYPPVADPDPEVLVPLRRTHFVVPATVMLTDIVLRTQQLGAANRRAERPVHV